MEAIRLASEPGSSAVQVERDLAIGQRCIRRWKRQLESDGEHTFQGKGYLKADDKLRQLEQENGGHGNGCRQSNIKVCKPPILTANWIARKPGQHRTHTKLLMKELDRKRLSSARGPFSYQNPEETMKDHISVCVPTFRRNQMLERLLRKVALQETGGLFDFSVVVVDNDAAGPARETVMRLRAELSLDISYGIEPEQTIPAARNHALRLARGNYIGIIDDDEFPTPHWLITMYRAIRTFDVDGGLGPVHPFFEEQPPAWLLKGRFCERPVHRTGTLLHWRQTRTGNVLLKKEVFDKHNLCFDVKFKTGGSDQEFFKQAMQTGSRFIAVEEAPVYEIVPPKRWTKSYYLKRALVNGFNSYRYGVSEKRGFSLVIVPVKSTVALLAYALVVPFCACLGSHVLMNCLERGCHHLSRLFAMLGIELVKKRDF